MSDQEKMQVFAEIQMSFFDEAAHYGAEWLQTVPGDELDDSPNSYHKAAVVAAMTKEPLMLCMLSDQEVGTVQPDELPKLLAWVRMHEPNI